MRTHIAKSLQTRCKAIQNAVKVYNTAALALSPPRPTVDWSRVSHYNFLDKFSLLRDTRQDVREKPWARPAHRETVRQFLRIQRAQEEILRCNVEIRRLHTAIYDEQQHFDVVQEDLRRTENPIAGAVDEFVILRRRVNAHILVRIQQMFDLEHFSGDKTLGTRKGTSASRPVLKAVQISGVEAEQVRLDADQDDIENEDDVNGDIGGLVDYISSVSIRN